MPQPATGCINIQYADITQIIIHPGKSRQLMANRTIGKIQKKISQYEKMWKIKTKIRKFKITPIAVNKNIVTDGTQLQFSTNRKILRVKMGRMGTGTHLEGTINKDKHALAELYRFRGLPTNIKIHLIRAFVIPILYYPPAPLVKASISNQKNLHIIQNRGLTFVCNEIYPYTRNTKSLHQAVKMVAINYNLHERTETMFSKIRHTKPTIQTPTTIL